MVVLRRFLKSLKEWSSTHISDGDCSELQMRSSRRMTCLEATLARPRGKSTLGVENRRNRQAIAGRNVYFCIGVPLAEGFMCPGLTLGYLPGRRG